ncbi:hypothetical protein K439DRAFT_1618329 [Ramaria rubella]|nr:hypothetical protein K439DRAFT_1618329 [Ramaria rubella]
MASRNMSSHSHHLLPFQALHTRVSMANLMSTTLPLVVPTPPPTTPLPPILHAPSMIIPAPASRFDRTNKKSHHLDDIAAELAIVCEIAQDLEDELWMMLEKHATKQSDTQTKAEMADSSECQVPFALIRSILRLSDLRRAYKVPEQETPISDKRKWGTFVRKQVVEFAYSMMLTKATRDFNAMGQEV